MENSDIKTYKESFIFRILISQSVCPSQANSCSVCGKEWDPLLEWSLVKEAQLGQTPGLPANIRLG